eukprot:COSAG06_NODE_17538_length_935_cov_1.278708_2_plen_166_part_00
MELPSSPVAAPPSDPGETTGVQRVGQLPKPVRLFHQPAPEPSLTPPENAAQHNRWRLEITPALSGGWRLGVTCLEATPAAGHGAAVRLRWHELVARCWEKSFTWARRVRGTAPYGSICSAAVGVAGGPFRRSSGKATSSLLAWRTPSFTGWSAWMSTTALRPGPG